ncbi:MAG: hypothetical protein K6A96_09645 [Prevotella sp.]|nr:hypothetical protein [Prevotella sp.]
MKKKIVIVAALFAALLVQAREITVVVRGTFTPNTGSTEVTRETDTLTVIPGRGVENIFITLRDSCGHVAEYYCVPAGWEDILNVVSPSLPDAYTLEIRDDKGVVYTED